MINESTTETDQNGEFNITLESNSEIDYYEVKLIEPLPGTNTCSSHALTISPGHINSNLILYINCK